MKHIPLVQYISEYLGLAHSSFPLLLLPPTLKLFGLDPSSVPDLFLLHNIADERTWRLCLHALFVSLYCFSPLKPSPRMQQIQMSKQANIYAQRHTQVHTATNACNTSKMNLCL